MLDTLKENFRKAKSELQGLAVSRGRRYRPLAEVNKKLLRDPKSEPAPAQPTHVMVRMQTGAPMRYYDDGSLRHAGGRKPGKKARRALRAKNRRKA